MQPADHLGEPHDLAYQSSRQSHFTALILIVCVLGVAVGAARLALGGLELWYAGIFQAQFW